MVSTPKMTGRLGLTKLAGLLAAVTRFNEPPDTVMDEAMARGTVVPLAVAGSDKVMEPVPTVTIVAPTGMPGPVTNSPTARPVVLATVTVALPLVVVEFVTIGANPVTAPKVSVMLLATAVAMSLLMVKVVGLVIEVM